MVQEIHFSRRTVTLARIGSESRASRTGVLTTSRLTVSHTNESSTASFTVPSFEKDTTLVLRFSAFDPLGCSFHDLVRIFVRAANRKPEVEAGPDQEVTEKDQVTFYGSGSGSDPDGDPLTQRQGLFRPDRFFTLGVPPIPVCRNLQIFYT
jgi:hypothetical protein